MLRRIAAATFATLLLCVAGALFAGPAAAHDHPWAHGGNHYAGHDVHHSSAHFQSYGEHGDGHRTAGRSRDHGCGHGRTHREHGHQFGPGHHHGYLHHGYPHHGYPHLRHRGEHPSNRLHHIAHRIEHRIQHRVVLTVHHVKPPTSLPVHTPTPAHPHPTTRPSKPSKPAKPASHRTHHVATTHPATHPVTHPAPTHPAAPPAHAPSHPRVPAQHQPVQHQPAHRGQHTPSKPSTPTPKPAPIPQPKPTPQPQPQPQPSPRAIELPEVGGLNSNVALVILGVVGAITLGAMGYLVSIGRRRDG